MVSGGGQLSGNLDVNSHVGWGIVTLICLFLE